MNCIYYFSTTCPKSQAPKITAKKATEDDLVYALNTHGFVYIPQENLFIIQRHELIHRLFADGVFQKNELSYLTNQLTEHTVIAIKNSKLKIKNSNLRFIIDPQKGMQDIIKRKIRAVDDPDKRFMEDALRMVRAIRFVSVINEKLKS